MVTRFYRRVSHAYDDSRSVPMMLTIITYELLVLQIRTNIQYTWCLCGQSRTLHKLPKL